MNNEITMESVKSELLEWRQNKHNQKGRKSIPDDLWNKSVFLASKHSIAQVAKYLNLSYTTLKQKTTEKDELSLEENPFVKVDLDLSLTEKEIPYSIKAQNKNGETIEVNASGIININSLLKAFFEK